MGREGVRLPVQQETLLSTSLIVTAPSAETQRAVNKGECDIVTFGVLLDSLWYVSLVVTVEGVDTKEGREKQNEKRTLLKL